MHELTIEGVGTFEVEEGTRLVRAIEEAGVGIGHRCGGQSQCTTCRVEFEDGEPGVMTRAEHEKLKDINQFGEMRLACQIVVDRDMTVAPLMTVEDQGWDDAGPDPAITVEPEPEWVSIETLEAEADAAGE
jgi:ferredoxin